MKYGTEIDSAQVIDRDLGAFHRAHAAGSPLNASPHLSVLNLMKREGCHLLGLYAHQALLICAGYV